MEVGLNMRLDLVSNEVMLELRKNFSKVFSGHPRPDYTESLGWENPKSFFLHWHRNNYFDEELQAMFEAFTGNENIEGAYVIVTGDDWYEIWVYTPELTVRLYDWEGCEIRSFLYPTAEQYDDDNFDESKFDEEKAFQNLMDMVRDKYLPKSSEK